MRRLLGEILVESGLSAERLKKALDLQKKRGGRIGTLLVRLTFVTEEDVLKALGAQLGLPYQADLGEIDRELALKLPITYAKKAGPPAPAGERHGPCRHVGTASPFHDRRPRGCSWTPTYRSACPLPKKSSTP